MVYLIIPIGPPGSGKTFLSNLLKKKFNDNFISISRDIIHNEFRKNHNIKKSKHFTHQKILQLIEESKNTNKIIYIDTTNSNQFIRDIYINHLQPEKHIYICFKGDHNIFLNRLQHRTHVTFPKCKIKQKELYYKIYNSITYPNNPKMDIIINENQEKQYDCLFNSLQEYLCRN